MPARPATRRRPASRPRGRPSRDATTPDVRADLLAAARRLFAARGFHEVGTREIARAACVNPAMIRYYFGDKEGLYRAMLETVFNRLVGDVGRIAVSAAGTSPIAQLVALYADTLARDPWIPRLVMREVLSDGAPFREEFVERFARPVSVLLPSIVRAEQGADRLRPDLDATLATLSLLGMILFPFLALPVASRVFDVELTDAFRRRFVAHTVKLFFDGAAPAARAS